jgi:hypothetical protein
VSETTASFDVDDPVDNIDPSNDFPLLIEAMGASDPLEVNRRDKFFVKSLFKNEKFGYANGQHFTYRRVEYNFSNFSRVVLPNNGLLMFKKDAGLSFAL